MIRSPERYKNLTDDQFEELCALEETEQEWRKSLPRHSEVEWLHIFPEALGRWAPRIRAQYKRELVMLDTDDKEVRYMTVKELLWNKFPWRDELIKERARITLAGIEKRRRALEGRLDYLKTLMNPNRVSEDKITPSMIARAKEYPIDQLVPDINPRTKFAKCIWHNDTHASMYCKGNFAHCYSCGKTGDTIAIVMQREGVKFREAVMRLQ